MVPTEAMLELRKYWMGNRAFQMLQAIRDRKIMLGLAPSGNDPYAKVMFSLDSLEYERLLPPQADARADQILEAIYNRGYLEVFREENRRAIADRIKELRPSVEFMPGKGKFTLKDQEADFEQTFRASGTYDRYLFINKDGLDLLARLENKKKEQPAERYIVSKNADGNREVAPGVGPLLKCLSETETRFYVDITPMEILDAEQRRVVGRGFLERKSENERRYYFIRKENVLAHNINPECYPPLVERTRQYQDRAATDQRNCQLELAPVQKKWADIAQNRVNAFEAELQESILNLTDLNEETGFVLEESDIEEIAATTALRL